MHARADLRPVRQPLPGRPGRDPGRREASGVKDEVAALRPRRHPVPRIGQPTGHARAGTEWAFNGWACLADVGKYLRRGSAWEALERLHQARAEYWRLLATSHEVPNPQYGITSLLDFAPDQVPARLALTTSDVDLARPAAGGQAASRGAGGRRQRAQARARRRPPGRDGGLHHLPTWSRLNRLELEPVLPPGRPTWQDQTRAILLRRVDDRPSATTCRLPRPPKRPGMTRWWCRTASAIREQATSTYPYNPDGTREFLDGKPFIEPFSLIPALGVVTERLRFTTFVLKLPMRNPVLVAKQATSHGGADGNRLLLGVGTSPWREDYDILGVPWERPRPAAGRGSGDYQGPGRRGLLRVRRQNFQNTEYQTLAGADSTHSDPVSAGTAKPCCAGRRVTVTAGCTAAAIRPTCPGCSPGSPSCAARKAPRTGRSRCT